MISVLQDIVDLLIIEIQSYLLECCHFKTHILSCLFYLIGVCLI